MPPVAFCQLWSTPNTFLPLGELTALPQTSNWLQKALLLREADWKGGEGKERGRRWEGREREVWKRGERDGREGGGGKESKNTPFINSCLRP